MRNKNDCSKEIKSDNAGGKIKLKHKGSYRRNNGPWDVDTATVEEVQLEELSEDELVNINEESGCDQKATNVPENMTLAKLL